MHFIAFPECYFNECVENVPVVSRCFDILLFFLLSSPGQIYIISSMYHINSYQCTKSSPEMGPWASIQLSTCGRSHRRGRGRRRRLVLRVADWYWMNIGPGIQVGWSLNKSSFTHTWYDLTWINKNEELSHKGNRERMAAEPNVQSPIPWNSAFFSTRTNHLFLNRDQSSFMAASRAARVFSDRWQPFTSVTCKAIIQWRILECQDRRDPEGNKHGKTTMNPENYI